mgnify:CR=1 FL=1
MVLFPIAAALARSSILTIPNPFSWKSFCAADSICVLLFEAMIVDNRAKVGIYRLKIKFGRQNWVWGERGVKR